MKRRVLCLWGLIVMVLAGCAWMQSSMERPHINIANVTAREIKVFEQVFDLELRIQNPNDSALDVQGLAFELEINERRFATGVSNQQLRVDRFSSGMIHVEAVSTLWGFLRQIGEMQQTGTPRVSYRLKGAVYVGSPSTKLPFEDSGEIRIPVEPVK
jgi:LEA14-like dessication related protein